jgi:hypothetical protein
VARAREFLASARTHPVAGLPPSVMARELAEARRQLGQLLTLVDDFEDEESLRAATGLDGDGGARIVPADVVTLGQAFADAIARRREHAAGSCADCDTSPAGLCAQGAGDLDRADTYTALGRALGIEAEQ